MSLVVLDEDLFSYGCVEHHKRVACVASLAFRTGVSEGAGLITLRDCKLSFACEWAELTVGKRNGC